MFRQKPDLKFIRANHVAHQEVIRPIITVDNYFPTNRTTICKLKTSDRKRDLGIWTLERAQLKCGFVTAKP